MTPPQSVLAIMKPLTSYVELRASTGPAILQSKGKALDRLLEESHPARTNFEHSSYQFLLSLAGGIVSFKGSMLAGDTKPPAQPDQADESTSPAPTPPVTNSNDSAGTHSLGDAKSAEEKSKDSDSVPTTESKASATPEINSDRSGAIRPLAPRSPASQWLIPKLSIAPHLARPSAILVTPPSRGSQPFRVNFSEKAVAATSSFAMTSQLSVLVSAEPGVAMAHKPARLEAGELVSFVWPRYPWSGDRSGLAEIIKVRATIGQLGRVLEVRFLSGSISLLPATTRAIGQWSYRPTLLDKRPVQAQQDVTIEFRPPQYSSKVSSQHPSHK
jgi:Gram-negative bacterial TonB protein C-terminal